MKKTMITISVLMSIFIALIIADKQFENGLFDEVKLWITPDPMERNVYDRGECTYYVFDKVKEDGKMIETSWNDAENWATRAEEDEYIVNDVPEEGAILQTEDGPIGHVAYIEQVHPDTSIEISEMNLNDPYEITTRTIDSNDIANYSFIHPKDNPHAEKYTG